MTEGEKPGRLRTKVCYMETTTYVPISSPSYNPEQRIHATALSLRTLMILDQTVVGGEMGTRCNRRESVKKLMSSSIHEDKPAALQGHHIGGA